MFYFITHHSDAIFTWLTQYFKFESQMQILPIDFTKPWYTIFFIQKTLLITSIIGNSLMPTYWIMFPIVVGHILTYSGIEYILPVLAVGIMLQITAFILTRAVIRYSVLLERSILATGYENLIKVDPAFHTTRSSGQVISKINRGSKSVYTMTDIILFSIVPILISSTVLLSSIIIVNVLLGVVALSVFGVFIVLSVIGFRFRTLITKRFVVRSEDRAMAVNVETMQQSSYVRSTFSTEDQIAVLRTQSTHAASVLAVRWRTSHYIISSLQMLGVVCLMCATWYMYILQLPAIVAIGILLSLVSIARSITEIGRSIDKAVGAIDDITDTFDFIRNFGKQSYPVLESDVSTVYSSSNKTSFLTEI